jgi:hypothetical protein
VRTDFNEWKSPFACCKPIVRFFIRIRDPKLLDFLMIFNRSPPTFDHLAQDPYCFTWITYLTDYENTLLLITPLRHSDFFKEKTVMSVEHIILYVAGAILLSITASRFLLQESITLARLFKQLIVEIRAPLPPTQPPVASVETRSKNVSDLAVRNNAGWNQTGSGLQSLRFTLPRCEARKQLGFKYVRCYSQASHSGLPSDRA